MIPRLSSSSIESTMTGANLVLNPVTGFLDPTSEPHRGASAKFGSLLKQKFIDLLRDAWPNISKVCKEVGVNRRTFSGHYHLDEKFRDLVDEIQEEKIDELEARAVELAFNPYYYVDRRETLKAFRPERYQPKLKVDMSVEHTITNPQERMQILSNSIDAEIVDQVKKLQFRNRSNKKSA